MKKENLLDFKSIITNNGRSHSMCTIGFFFGRIPINTSIPDLSFKSLFSFMQLKYTSESSYCDYKKEPIDFIFDLLGVNLRSLTPLMLSKSESPFEETIIKLGDPDQIFLRQPDNVVPYAMLWNEESLLKATSCGGDVNHGKMSIMKIASIGARKSLSSESRLLLAAVPGWSFDSFCENRLSTYTRKEFLGEEFIYDDRIL